MRTTIRDIRIIFINVEFLEVVKYIREMFHIMANKENV